nr:Ig lambda light chain [Monodelphis domestica]
MAWPLVCLSLLSFCSGSLSQAVVTQPPSASAALGSSARFSCTLSSQHRDYAVDWYQQSPGKPPRYLLYVTNSGRPSRGDGIPERFSGSSSGADRFLSISSVQPEDEADYFCGYGYFSGGSYRYVFGGGTKLIVTGLPKASPMVMAYGPSQDELRTPTATLTCLISGFSPRSLDVTWTKNGSPVSSGVLTSQPVRQTDNKYSASSYLSVNPNQWGGNNRYLCKVTHEGQVIEKELSASQCT